MSQWTKKQQKEINQAKHVLADGEVVLDVTTGTGRVTRMGQRTQRSGALIATDRRVIFYTKKLGGYEMSDHVYGLLTSVDYKKGMMTGGITLAASGDHYHVSMVPKEDVERFAKCVRSQMAAVRAHAASPVNNNHDTADIPSQIAQLAALRDQGILSNEEFEAKKSDLLSRM